VYCECGLTTNLTTQPAEYVPTQEVLDELDNLLSTNPPLDFITFSGNGEPTLHSKIFEIAEHIKSNYPQYKICLITNSTMFTHPDFMQKIINNQNSAIDVIMPSLDAVSQPVYEKIDQPESSIKAQAVTEALIDFSHQFKGKIWLEIFILPGVNDTENELKQFGVALKRMRVDKILLNCLDRPAPYQWVKPASIEQMQRVKNFFSEQDIETEIIGKVQKAAPTQTSGDPRHTIIELISRRPATLEDLAQATGKPQSQISKLLNELSDHYQIEKTQLQRGIFYRIIK
jgi:wyosine [tRNA(Phe)-imidazoG37] synthetase (radical SAM superfamily)